MARTIGSTRVRSVAIAPEIAPHPRPEELVADPPPDRRVRVLPCSLGGVQSPCRVCAGAVFRGFCPMADQDWPVAVNHHTTEGNAGRAYLPSSLWCALGKQHPLRPSSLVEVLTADACYYVHPLPAPTIHQASVELHNPLYTFPSSGESVPRPKCRLGRVWTERLPRANRVVLSSEAELSDLDGASLLGRAIMPGGRVMLGAGKPVCIVAVEPTGTSPLLCTPLTTFHYTRRREERAVDVPTDYVDAGASAQLEEIVQAYALTARHSRPISLPQGFLLSGPPGVGKTHLVRSLAQRHCLPVILINGPEIVSAHRGVSEQRLRSCFAEAQAAAQGAAGCSILFIDELDSIAGKREEGRDQHQVRLLAQLLTLLDGADSQRSKVLFVGATNRPAALDPALRRPGRIDREIIMEPPDAATRRRLLLALLTGFTLDAPFLDELARQTHGYVPADLTALCRDLILTAAKASPVVIDASSIQASLAKIGPSIMREYRMDIPTVETWKSLGGLARVKEAVQRAVEWPLRFPEAYSRLGLQSPRGVLLHGPPGCSKTSIARILVASHQFSFFSLDGASVFSCYLGEAERLVRQVFANARLAAPSLIFIDEVDALVGRRGSGAHDEVQERVLSTLLNEMDGIVALREVIVVGATNRLEAIDDALKRPGRFDALIHVPLPDEQDRLEILQVLAQKSPLAADIDLALIAGKTAGYSGASLTQLVQEAAQSAIRADRDHITLHDLNLKL